MLTTNNLHKRPLTAIHSQEQAGLLLRMSNSQSLIFSYISYSLLWRRDLLFSAQRSYSVLMHVALVTIALLVGREVVGKVEKELVLALESENVAAGPSLKPVQRGFVAGDELVSSRLLRKYPRRSAPSDGDDNQAMRECKRACAVGSRMRVHFSHAFLFL